MAQFPTGIAYCPAIPMTFDMEWRLRKAQFGDGYQQRTLDGINALNRKWQVRFEMKPIQIIDNITVFLIQQQGAAFMWVPPTGMGSAGVEVFCDQWSQEALLRQESGAVYATLTAEFVEANGVTVRNP